MSILNNYYVNSFFWSTFQKIISAVVGFISVPLLLGYYGKAEYGVLGIATACNGYMHLLDLGMNTGAVKYYSQWRSKGDSELIWRVARTNISFYGIVSLINIIVLVVLAIWGEGLFAVTHEHFYELRYCLLILALFSIFSWGTTTFQQLLVAHLQMAYTMKVQSIMAIMKGVLIGLVFLCDLSLIQYFFYLTAIVASLVLPYAIKCKRLGIIDGFTPAYYWKDFKVVLFFSLSIFALSLFQMTATQSRPIILSIFADNGAEAVADFRIIEVIPQLIIMIGGTFSGIFLPKVSSMVSERNQDAISLFAYKWTKYTTIIVNILSIPFILSAKEILTAYVGDEYNYLTPWLIIWCITVLIQMHTTPGNALVLAYGKTKLLVISTGIFCILSLFLNAFLCSSYGVGAAVISYLIYVILVIGLYYVEYYKKLLQLSRRRMLKSFLYPTLISLLVLVIVYNIPITFISQDSIRLTNVLVFSVKTLLWIIPYFILLAAFKVIDFKELRKS